MMDDDGVHTSTHTEEEEEEDERRKGPQYKSQYIHAFIRKAGNSIMLVLVLQTGDW